MKTGGKRELRKVFSEKHYSPMTERNPGANLIVKQSRPQMLIDDIFAPRFQAAGHPLNISPVARKTQPFAGHDFVMHRRKPGPNHSVPAIIGHSTAPHNKAQTVIRIAH
jgi:hypothetical protein